MGHPRVTVPILTQRPFMPETPSWSWLSLGPVTLYSSFPAHLEHADSSINAAQRPSNAAVHNYLPNARNAACVVLGPLS